GCGQAACHIAASCTRASLLTSEGSLVRTQLRPAGIPARTRSASLAMTPMADAGPAVDTLVPAVRPVRREGDLAAVDRDQLDPGVAGVDIEFLTLLHGQLDPGGRRLALVPG